MKGSSAIGKSRLPSSSRSELEGGCSGRRAVRHGLGRDVAVDGGADPLEQRQHRRGAAGAVQPDDVRARLCDPRGRPRRTRTPSIVVVARRGERDDGRQAGRLDHLECDQRLAEVVVRLGDDQVGALLDRPADLLAVHLAHDLARRGRGRRGRRPRCCRCCRRRARRLRRRPRGRGGARRLSGSRSSSRPICRSFSRWP